MHVDVRSKHTVIGKCLECTHTALMTAYLGRPTVTCFVSLTDTIPAFGSANSGRGHVGEAGSQIGGTEGSSNGIHTTATPLVRDYRALHC